MKHRVPQIQATLAQTTLLVALGLTGLAGLFATSAYIWHLYRLAAPGG